MPLAFVDNTRIWDPGIPAVCVPLGTFLVFVSSNIIKKDTTLYILRVFLLLDVITCTPRYGCWAMIGQSMIRGRVLAESQSFACYGSAGVCVCLCVSVKPTLLPVLLPPPPPPVWSAPLRSAELPPAACPSWCRKMPRAGLETEQVTQQVIICPSHKKQEMCSAMHLMVSTCN